MAGRARPNFLAGTLHRLPESARQAERFDLRFIRTLSYPPCDINWTDLYREPDLVAGILKTWRDDGVPANVPLMNTESNVSWELTDPMQDVFSALWLADSVGAFLANGGAVYYHSPIQPEPLRPGCRGWSTYGNFVADEKLDIRQHTSQYFASQLLNLDWVKHGAGEHQLYPASVDLQDDAGHKLITAYAVKRPDGQWSLLVINKDPSNAHEVNIAFASDGKDISQHFTDAMEAVTFGTGQYVWKPFGPASHAEPAGPAKRSQIQWQEGQKLKLPKASVTVITGKTTGAP
jgi:hypothetical protein